MMNHNKWNIKPKQNIQNIMWIHSLLAFPNDKLFLVEVSCISWRLFLPHTVLNLILSTVRIPAFRHPSICLEVYTSLLSVPFYLITNVSSFFPPVFFSQSFHLKYSTDSLMYHSNCFLASSFWLHASPSCSIVFTTCNLVIITCPLPSRLQYQPHTILTSSFRDTHLLTELPQDILQKMHGSSHNVAPHALINTLPIQISSPSEYRCENSLSPQSWYLNPDALQIWPPFHMFNDTKTILPILPWVSRTNSLWQASSQCQHKM